MFLLMSGEVEMDRQSVTLNSTLRISARTEVHKQFLHAAEEPRRKLEMKLYVIRASRITGILDIKRTAHSPQP